MTKNGESGNLGQICKMINEGSETADFLSKTLVRTMKGWSACRIAGKALLSGLHHRLDRDIASNKIASRQKLDIVE